MKYYFHAEDLVGVIVGPFDSTTAAEAHQSFLLERGDAAILTLITDQEALHYLNEGLMLISATEDLLWHDQNEVGLLSQRFPDVELKDLSASEVRVYELHLLVKKGSEITPDDDEVVLQVERAVLDQKEEFDIVDAKLTRKVR